MTDPVRRLADAVLYEGYLLWPYRASALKNQRRWTFGGVFPRDWSEAHPDDRWRVRAEVLLEGEPDVDVRVRFLRSTGADHEVAPGPIAQDGLDATVEVSCAGAGEGRSRVCVEVANTTPFAGTREEALAHTLCSAHVLLRAPRGRFMSATDPAAAAACRSEGLWPVLVEDEHTMLAAPIILEDFPQIAPESPGDLFDGGEIDELLILNVLTLTDDEKAEIRAGDPRGRELLERCESVSEEQLLRLHGAWRP